MQVFLQLMSSLILNAGLNDGSERAMDYLLSGFALTILAITFVLETPLVELVSVERPGAALSTSPG